MQFLTCCFYDLAIHVENIFQLSNIFPIHYKCLTTVERSKLILSALPTELIE